MLSFYPAICYNAVLLNLTCYAQYYVQEQELLSNYYSYTVYAQVSLKNSLHKQHNSL